MKKSATDAEPTSPIPFRHGSNGEFVPPERTERDDRAEALFRRVVDEKSRRLGLSRRAFAEGACGTAAALWVINTIYGCGGDETQATSSGGTYGVDAGDTEDAGSACERLAGDEFVFDVQTHHVTPAGDWRDTAPLWEAFFASLPQAACGESDPVGCFGADNYVREMFLESDTHLAVLSAVPASPDANPLTVEEQAATREIVNRLANSERCVIHGLVQPENGEAELDGMQRLAEELRIAAWKVYTPTGGFRLDDEDIGIPFIERARELGIKIVCAHKGLPIAGFDPAFASPDDIGPVAAAYPDVRFLVYHSGFETDTAEGPYDPAGQGIDRLIKTVLDHGIGKDGNVYAELGSTWRYLMTKPDEAAHAIGKLLLHLGEDRIVWGTDSIWYGSPQDQIAAFRTFQISEQLQETHGYPALTAAVRAKIFGLNAAAAYGIDAAARRCVIDADDFAKEKLARRGDPSPRFRAYGPRTRQEFFAFLRSRGGQPG